MIDYFQHALAAVKRTRRRLRFRVAAELLGGTITVAATAYAIQEGRPWWVITLGVLCIFAWAVQASRTVRRLEQAGADQDKLETIVQEATNVAGLLRDIGFNSDMLRGVTGAAATDTTDEDPDSTPTPAPAAEPGTPRT